MNLAESRETLARRHALWARLLDGIDGPASRHVLTPTGPSLAWLVGHNTANTDSVIEAVGATARVLDDAFEARHASSHFGATDDAGWDRLRADWEAVTTRLRAVLDGLAEGDLARPPAVEIHPQFRDMLTTRAAFLDGHLFHLTWHAGQAGMLRADLGLDA